MQTCIPPNHCFQSQALTEVTALKCIKQRKYYVSILQNSNFSRQIVFPLASVKVTLNIRNFPIQTKNVQSATFG